MHTKPPRAARVFGSDRRAAPRDARRRLAAPTPRAAGRARRRLAAPTPRAGVSRRRYGQFILWPKTYATASERLECNSKDGVRIEVKVRFQYLPRQKSLYELTGLYQKEEAYQVVMKWHARSAIRNGCALYLAQEFQTKRSLVQEEIYNRLTTRLDDRMGTDVIDVQLTNIERPAE